MLVAESFPSYASQQFNLGDVIRRTWGRLWFNNGWGRFYRDLSLEAPTFLLLEYNYTNVLDVKIMRKDQHYAGTEINYPPVNGAGTKVGILQIFMFYYSTTCR